MPTPKALTTHLRGLFYAAIAGSIAMYIVLGYYFTARFASADVDQIWWAARAVLHGQDPYQTIRTSGFPFPFYYPLTAAIAGLPLGFLSLDAARAVFVAGGAALMGYAVGRERPYLWPTFLGLPFLISARSGNWSAILTAAMLLPALGWLAAAKPNVGVAMLAGARTRRDALVIVAGGAALLAVSLAVEPRWPWAWREALSASTHFRPLLLRPGGFVMLAALLCWRDPDARLLLALAVVPQTGFFYEELPACLVSPRPKTGGDHRTQHPCCHGHPGILPRSPWLQRLRVEVRDRLTVAGPRPPSPPRPSPPFPPGAVSGFRP